VCRSRALFIVVHTEAIWKLDLVRPSGCRPEGSLLSLRVKRASRAIPVLSPLRRLMAAANLPQKTHGSIAIVARRRIRQLCHRRDAAVIPARILYIWGGFARTLGPRRTGERTAKRPESRKKIAAFSVQLNRIFNDLERTDDTVSH
jgi:hypothetical protein